MLSLFTFLVAGGLVGYIVRSDNFGLGTDSEPIVVEMDSLRAPGGIPENTEMAQIIVIGEIVKISDLSERTGLSYPRSIIDAEIQVSEVLKGDPDTSEVIVTAFAENENVWTEDSVSLKVGERILVMLAVDAEGNNVIFAGPDGKFVIDENNQVKDGTGAMISLENLKMQIAEALTPTLAP